MSLQVNGFMPRVTLPCAVLALSAATAFGQVPAGPEFQVSVPPGTVQWSEDIAMDAAGNFVVAWLDFGPVNTITARRYDATGNPRGAVFVVSQNAPYIQGYPKVATAPGGRFAVVWYAGAPGAGTDFQARLYDAAGTPLGPRFTVNTFTPGYQGPGDVAADAAGNFVVVWSSYAGEDGSGASVHGQRFTTTGARLGSEFRANTVTTGDQKRPVVAASAGGDFVIVWVSDDGSSTGLFAQRYDAAGNAAGPEFRVNTVTAGQQYQPAVTADSAGNFIVTWTTPGAAATTVVGQRFSAAGAPIGGEFPLATNPTTQKGAAAISSDQDGDFVAAWSSGGAQDGSSFGVFGQRFDASGARHGAEFRVNTTTLNGQTMGSIAMDRAGNFVVVFDHNPQGGDLQVLGQRFGGLLAAPTQVDAAGNGVLEPAEPVVAAPSWRNANGVAQTFSGVASNFTGPGVPGITYTILDAVADYGTVANGAVGSCTVTGNCYAFHVSAPTLTPMSRPVLHWDATFREDLLPTVLGQSPTRRLHIGDSFTDVPRSSPFYRFVETILHLELTGGCGGGNFCPLAATPREQMAVFVLVAKEGAGYQPPACVPGLELFADVPASSPFCRWIEELARRNIAGGCGGGNFCPLGVVSREQMAVLALATKEPAGYSPVPCVAGGERFPDVPAASPFCKWIEELARRNIAGGCGGGNFCPVAEVTREQNAVFVSGAFALALY